MAKKIIKLTEQDLTKIVQKVINEQSLERDFVKGLQMFLNEKLKLIPKLEIDGKTGPGSNTEAAIEKYQSMIKVYPADGVWGEQTTNKMPDNDKKMLKYFVSKTSGSLVDKVLNLIGL